MRGDTGFGLALIGSAVTMMNWATYAGAHDRPVDEPVMAQDTKPNEAPISTTPPALNWIANLSTGVLARDGEAARPFLVGGLSRRVGRGYVRVSATDFHSVVRQIDAVLPSRFVIASIGGGGTFGKWFVDGSASAGRQRYGGVTTALGTRSSEVGNGSGVYGAALNAGRFVAVMRRLYLTPSATIQYSGNKTLRAVLGPTGPQDYLTSERAWTGSASVRLDRFFGGSNQHLVGISISKVQTSNGAVVLAGSAAGGGILNDSATSVADGWYVAGASSSVRVTKQLWLDGAATRTIGARSGDVNIVSLGLRVGWR